MKITTVLIGLLSILLILSAKAALKTHYHNKTGVPVLEYCQVKTIFGTKHKAMVIPKGISYQKCQNEPINKVNCALYSNKNRRTVLATYALSGIRDCNYIRIDPAWINERYRFRINRFKLYKKSIINNKSFKIYMERS